MNKPGVTLLRRSLENTFFTLHFFLGHEDELKRPRRTYCKGLREASLPVCLLQARLRHRLAAAALRTPWWRSYCRKDAVLHAITLQLWTHTVCFSVLISQSEKLAEEKKTEALRIYLE